jgi:CRISPR-associated exonuclease Cas4
MVDHIDYDKTQFAEDELIPISGLQHIIFCERQFALIHVEQLWAENRYTVEGSLLHERVHVEHHESRRYFRQEYGMAVRSLKYGIIGKCDLVELYLKPDRGICKAIPIEFKRGKNKETDCDRVQLCAQALCLEEMFGNEIINGAFNYLGDHRRTDVEISIELKNTTISAIERARQILERSETPPAHYESKKCDRCSLADICMPTFIADGGRRVQKYLQLEVAAVRRECSE